MASGLLSGLAASQASGLPELAAQMLAAAGGAGGAGGAASNSLTVSRSTVVKPCPPPKPVVCKPSTKH
jgi:hypothetical protein